MTTVRAASALLGSSEKTVRALVDLGLLARSGVGKSDLDPASVQLLAARPVFTARPAGVRVVIVNPAEDAQDGRPFKGWKADLDAYDQDQLDGVTKWWSVGDPSAVETLIVAKDGWILHAYDVRGFDPDPTPGSTRVGFDVTPPPAGQVFPAATARFEGHRLPQRLKAFGYWL
jgi:hypothetical protein